MMTPMDVAKSAAAIAGALADEFSSGVKGVGLLPERYAFSISIDASDEQRFLQVLEALLRANEATGQEPPINVLAFCAAFPSHHGNGLDQTDWKLVFEPNPLRTAATDAEVAAHLDSLSGVLSEYRVAVRHRDSTLRKHVAVLGTQLRTLDESHREVAEALNRDPRIAPYVHPDYACDVQVLCRAGEDAPSGYNGSLIWVRVGGVGREPDTWIGEVLNADPVAGLNKGDLVLVACDHDGPKLASRLGRSG